MRNNEINNAGGEEEEDSRYSEPVRRVDGKLPALPT